jgi:hypothetical protein
MNRSYDGGGKLLRNFGNPLISIDLYPSRLYCLFNGAVTSSNGTHNSLLKAAVQFLLLSVYSLQFHTCDVAAHVVIIQYISR